MPLGLNRPVPPAVAMKKAMIRIVPATAPSSGRRRRRVSHDA